MWTFSRKYFFLALTLLIIEILIAVYVRDRFVRPYFGDYLVVMLVYCTVRAFVNASPVKIAMGVLLFACLVEILQYFRIVDRLGLSNNTVAKTVIGHGFEWWDILAYVLGVVTILFLERPHDTVK